MIDTKLKSFDIWTDAQGIKSKTRIKSVDNISHQGILKLRELILILAFQGKLLKQDQKDEPALNILKRIEMKLGCKIKTYSNSQYDIPNSWEWCSIGDISNHNTGKTLDAKKNKGELREYITTSNLYWGFFKLSNLQKMAISESETDRCTAVKGDLLICEGGEAGRSAVWESDYPVCFQNHIHRVRPFEEINPYYLYYYMMKIFYSGEIQNYRQGVGISSMSGRALSSITFPLSPLDEQSRIVVKIKELFALCDTLEQEKFKNLKTHQVLVKTLLETLTQAADVNELQSAWGRMSKHFDTLFCTDDSIDQLKQTILQLAVMGKLVKQDPKDEPADELLKKINKEKEKLVEEGKIRKHVPLPKISENEMPFKLPSGWEVTRLGNVIHLVSGQHLKPEEYVELRGRGMLPYLTGPAEFGETHPVPTRYTIEKRSIALKGDILITCKGSGVGKTNIANTDIAISRQLMAIRAIVIDFQYLKLLIDSLYETFRGNIIGIAIPGISREDITEAIIILPPLSEQHRIVFTINQISAVCDALKVKIQESQNIKVLLSKTIVVKAVQ